MVATKKDRLTGDSLGTGRRKSSVARVRIRAGSGKITINDRPFEEYFPDEGNRKWILDVLESVNRTNSVDVIVRVNGGGATGQSGAIRMGVARALVGYDEATFPAMRDNAFLTRDSRMKERKKYGLHGARRGVQFSKR
jgi:small subunit ribosomal protein S9